MVEISLIGTFIAAIIQLDRIRDVVFRHVGYGVFFASFFIAFIVQMLQKRITNLVFVENRTRFSIQNRAPFLHYWYFMMLTSMTRALTSYILRTFKLIFRYPLFSVRVDRNAETWSVRRGDGGKLVWWFACMKKVNNIVFFKVSLRIVAWYTKYMIYMVYIYIYYTLFNI